MTVRVPNPEAGGLARISQDVVESGDGAWYPVVGGFVSLGSIIGSIITVANAGPEWFALLVPALFYIATIASYRNSTVELSDQGSAIYRRVIYQHMPKIRGTSVEALAQPMVEKIWEHTRELHAGKTAYYGSDCKLCKERENTIIELIPEKAWDTQDIDAAKRYLEMKQEADAQHERALKELLP